jgi:hypothetical protein
MDPGVDQVLEVAAVLGPMRDFFDRGLDLAARDGDRAADLGDHHSAQSFLVALQRLGQLGQAVIAEIQIARPIGLVERPPCGTHGALHVGDGAVGCLACHLLAGRMDHVELRTTAGVLELAVDQHPLVAGQHP